MVRTKEGEGGKEGKQKKEMKPKRDGSGKGIRANRGRGGCVNTRSKGKR